MLASSHTRRTATIVVAAGLALSLALTGCGSSGADAAGGSADSSAATTFEASDYQDVDYAALAQRPDDYKGSKLHIVGKAIQVDESGNPTVLRVATSADGYDDIVWVEVDSSLLDGNHITQDQYVGVYGTCLGQKTYTSVLGGNVSIPGITAERVDTDVQSPQEVQNGQIQALFDGVTFDKKDNGYGYYTYSATVTNTTANDYSNVSVLLGLYDENGTRVSETSAMVSSWAAGEGAVFEAVSDTDAAQVQPKVEYYSIGSDFYSVD